MPTDIFNVVELRAVTKVLKREGVDYDIRALKKEIWAEDMSVAVELSGVISDVWEEGNWTQKYDIVFATSGEPKRKRILTEDSRARDIIKGMYGVEKVVAAICATVPILVDIVEGKRVTCYDSHSVKGPLKRAGAILDMRTVVIDGKVITAQAPPLAEIWAEVAVRVARGEEVEEPAKYAYKNPNLGVYHIVE